MVCERIEEIKAPAQKRIEMPSYEDLTAFSNFDPASSPFDCIEEPIGNDLSLEAFNVVDF
ncbi:hypothetical protein TVAG_300920 [Trichomonas vaginalis G3]|uniref:Uncharacterized protein n=1 Tax=Trichomonas vaginalis (strain ATCC PRA-98 / G3) TaxID=412133 RepID=A2FKM3_TRIV3|nr:hypothetical protein TVAGG3_0271120 [Trichomonas vaginalis G3]EAX94559.1 hypothetical protein TVAG_300920 [Trichomonas vaginalis G3]KAI5525872.1 hypothetical protein TVAGG3_0271120 [Trichomonas vaginalis G3]|eukprot:XP_001307489.1 hypothetical protein [Trichomonas vaginalis G3]